jgi:hypothetical protein
MNNIVILEMGDPSNDGHGQTYQYVVKSNFNAVDIECMYQTASSKHALDITSECEDYEENTPSKRFTSTFKKVFANNPAALQLIPNDDGEVGSIWYEEHAEIYLLIAQLDNPELKWEETTNNLLINIGGYGYGT